MMPTLKEIHRKGFEGKVEVVSSKGKAWYENLVKKGNTEEMETSYKAAFVLVAKIKQEVTHVVVWLG